MAEQTATEIAHAWQSFRERCIEHAIKSGATPETLVDVAKTIATHIMTKSEAEKAQAEAKKEPE